MVKRAAWRGSNACLHLSSPAPAASPLTTPPVVTDASWHQKTRPRYATAAMRTLIAVVTAGRGIAAGRTNHPGLKSPDSKACADGRRPDPPRRRICWSSSAALATPTMHTPAISMIATHNAPATGLWVRLVSSACLTDRSRTLRIIPSIVPAARKQSR